MRRLTLLLLPCAAALLFAVEVVKTPINNDDVRVLDVVLQPHEKTSMHEHKVNRVMIYRNSGEQTFQYEDGHHSVLKFGENEVKWSPIEGKHIAEVSTEKPLNLIELELKKPGAGKTITAALDPLRIDKKHYKLEFENDQVRVFRVKFAPRDSTPMHEHTLNRISVFVTDANIRSTTADGKVTVSTQKAGDIVQGAALKHSEQNLRDTPAEIIVTEFKY